MKKQNTSELFEGENSSLRKTFDNAVFSYESNSSLGRALQGNYEAQNQLKEAILKGRTSEISSLKDEIEKIPLHNCDEGCINCGETEAQEIFREECLSLLTKRMK